MNIQAGISLPNISFELGKIPIRINIPLAADFNILPHGDNRNVEIPIILGCIAGGLLVLSVVAKVILDKKENANKTEKNITKTDNPKKADKNNE
jgi:hypothetical protein